MSHIYTDTKPSDNGRPSIETYPDLYLLDSIESLRAADYLGKWGGDRLESLEAEARRRGLNCKQPSK
jgi:hypothetical protein